MLSPDHIKSLKQLLADLKIAENELCRPQEHVVAFSVCYTVQQSVHSMMRLFLLSKGINAGSGISMLELFKECCRVDGDFCAVPFGNIFCKDYKLEECNGKFCQSLIKVTDCLEIATQVKSIIQKKLPVNGN